MELRRKIKKLKLRTEFSSRRLRKPDPNSTSASVMLADHFRALRQVDLFKVDFAVKNVNFLRDDCLPDDNLTAGFSRQLHGINREFELLIAKTPVTSNTSNVTPIRSEIAEVEHLRILNRALLQRNSVLAARLEYHGKLYKLHCKTIKDDVVTELLKMFKMMYTEDGVVTWSKRDDNDDPMFCSDNVVKVMNELMKALDVLEKVVKNM